jgi:F-box-like
VTIDMLPDDLLLEIFDWYLEENPGIDELEEWHTLVHVCRKWRNLVLQSPRRLNLRLLCDGRRPVREKLNIWPPLPIVIYGWKHEMPGITDIVAAFDHNDRICQVLLWDLSSSLLERVAALMQQPFPALTSLGLSSDDNDAPTLSDSFLGGSAPRLQHLQLNCIPCPGLPKLLLSATGLVTLRLRRIPHSGYFSPEAMIIVLSASTRLEEFELTFQSPQSRPDSERLRPLPSTRSVVRALTHFEFHGVSEYLEDLVARIDAPLLDLLNITFFHQIIFHTPQLAQFISRTPQLKAGDEARVVFYSMTALVTLSSPKMCHRILELKISCTRSDWRLSSMAQICSSSLPLISSLERLYVYEKEDVQSCWQNDIENVQWLELLRPFNTVKALYLSLEFTPRIAPAFQELVAGRATEVLPALRSIFLEQLRPSTGVQEAIETFVAARQFSGHPIAISYWDRK